MKKILVAILSIVYLSTSVGATVHLHYCMDRLVSWGLADHSGKSCDFCGMMKKGASGDCAVGMKGCCHDESKQIKTDKDQKTAQDISQVVKMAPAIADIPQPVWVNAVVLSPIVSQPAAHGPPLVGHIPLFLRNRNFRI